LVQALAGAGQSFDLRRALRAAADQMPFPVTDATLADVQNFIRDRLYVWLRDQGLPHDVVTAVLAERGHNPALAAAAARGLAALAQSPDWNDLLVAYARSKRIVRNLAEQYTLAPEHYTEPAAQELYTAYLAAEHIMREAPESKEVAALGESLRLLRDPINRLFTDLLVMADDPAVRQARLALIQRIAALPAGIADLSQMQGF
jgi:glycyl-tRNA synthetase